MTVDCVLTMSGGHPLAIVSKSGQCHIKVRNYLRKQHILSLQIYLHN